MILQCQRYRADLIRIEPVHPAAGIEGVGIVHDLSANVPQKTQLDADPVCICSVDQFCQFVPILLSDSAIWIGPGSIVFGYCTRLARSASAGVPMRTAVACNREYIN